MSRTATGFRTATGRRNPARVRRVPGLYYAYGGGYGWSGAGYAPWLYYPWLDADLSYDLWHDSGDSGVGDTVGANTGGTDGGGDISAAPAGTYDADAAQAGETVNEAEGDGSDALMHPTAASMTEDTAPATLLFSDGRKPIRTSNYVVSAEGVTVSDGGRVQVVPIAELDVAATNRLNADAGTGLHVGP